MTEDIYLEVSGKAEATHKAQRRVTVSGILKYLGVSRSGYRAWLKRIPLNAEKHRETVKAKNILDENFNLERPNTVWYSEITYIWTTEGGVYLTSIIDLFSRKSLHGHFSKY